MDKSFGYNKLSRPQDYITADEVIAMLDDIVPKKGRLLLNAGPDSFGNIADYQVKILENLEGRIR